MSLTKRQTQIVTLLAQGNTADQVAQIMHRSTGTVRRHVVLACERVQARNITHLVAKSISHGWISALCLVLAVSIVLDQGGDKFRQTARVRVQRTSISRLEC